MSYPLVLSCLWVLAATFLAFLPIRYQIVPGLGLLAAAPVLIVWLAIETNVWIGVAAVAAFLSMFRKPLTYMIKRLLGKTAPNHERRRP